MKINLWGVRGSIPTTGPDTAIYGGNTSCAAVWEDGRLLILDGGSGMHRLELKHPLAHKRIDILLTHLHLDHIQGLGFFQPFFDPKMEIHLYGPASSHRTLHSRLSRYLSPPLFPVLLRDLPCKLVLHEVENSVINIGPFTVHSSYVIHPGPTVGYRIEGARSALAYLPDHEPALGRNGMINDRNWISAIDLAADADVLLHDAQYTTEEYASRKGWGHSSLMDAVRFASVAGAKYLLLSHHDPSRSDSQLEELYDRFRNENHLPVQTDLAREGMEFEV
jgi:phosphoribosyl 1,2-cyclic phosphodiesterase